MKTTRILVSEGMKQIGAVTSAERGFLVTMAVAVRASGNSIPPFFIFPRDSIWGYLIATGQNDNAGSAYKSRWMTGYGFLLFMKNFIKHASVRKDKLSGSTYYWIIISHMSLHSLSFALPREIRAALLSFPPHSTRNLKP
jgi:hypothetical protein